MSADHHFMFPRAREMTAEERAAEVRLVRSAVRFAPVAPKASETPPPRWYRPLRRTGAVMRGADELIAELRLGRIHTVAFVVPSEATGTLPLYEVAIATARRGWSLGIEDARYWFVTPEPVPLAYGSPAARAAVGARLEPEGVTFVGSTFAELRPGIVLLDPQGESLVVDRVVTLAEAAATSWRPVAGARTHPFAAPTRDPARRFDGRELVPAGATVAA